MQFFFVLMVVHLTLDVDGCTIDKYVFFLFYIHFLISNFYRLAPIIYQQIQFQILKITKK